MGWVWVCKSFDYMDASRPEHRDILHGLEASAKIDSILGRYRNEPRIPLPDRAILPRACFTYVQSQAALVRHYHPGTPLFNVTTKSHYVLHIGMIAHYINPGYGAVWRGEDMMRVVRSIVSASSVGNSVTQAQVSSMDRYSRAIGFELGLGN